MRFSRAVCVGSRVWLRGLALWLAVLFPFSAFAQSGAYTLPAIGVDTYGTLSEAEAALEQVTGRDLELIGVAPENFVNSNALIYEYRVRRVEPTSYDGTYFGFTATCSGPPTGNSPPSFFCVSLAELIDAVRADHGQCASSVTITPMGDYVPQQQFLYHYAERVQQDCPAPPGQLYGPHDLVLKTVYTAECGGVPAGTEGYSGVTVQSFAHCPADYTMESNGFHPIWNEEGIKMCGPALPVGTSDGRRICQSNYERSFVYRIRRSMADVQEACEANGNPCVPAQASKIRIENDLTLFGMDFARQYTSAALDHGLYGLGPNWKWTFSRRVMYSVNGVVVTQGDGTLEKFVRRSTTELVWRSLNDPRNQARFGDNGGWIVETARYVYLHDALGLLYRITDKASGQVTEFGYRTYKPDLIERISQNGRSVVFHYDDADQLVELELPGGETIGYSYTDTLLTQVDYPGGTNRKYKYAETGLSQPQHTTNLTGIYDETGARLASFSYDVSARATGSRLWKTPTAYIDDVVLTYNPDDTVTAVDANGASVEYGFTSGAFKRVLSIEKTGGSQTSHRFIGHDGDGRISSFTDPGGSVTTYQYDNDGNQTEAVESSNHAATKRTVQTDWSDGRPTERRVYDHLQNLVVKTHWTYNARGQLTNETATDPATSETRIRTLQYCESADVVNGICPEEGLLVSSDGPRTDVSDVVSYAYYLADDAGCASSGPCAYRAGQLWKTTNAAGQVVETTAYDADGRVLSQKDPNGVATDFTYHPMGWLTSRKVRGTNNSVETDDQVTSIEYWPTGLVKKVVQPDGEFTTYAYDGAHRLTDLADNAGNTIHYEIDAAGNITAEQIKDGSGNLRHALSRAYDQLGRMQSESDAYSHSTAYTYDANDDRQTATDALSRVRDNDYDPLRRLVRALDDVGGISAETKYEYDALDNVAKTTDPKGLDTVYLHNAFKNLIQLGSPDTGVSTYTYDKAGNRKTYTDARSVTATYTYDALNRPTSISYPTASLNASFVYDTVNAACVSGEDFAVGRLTKMVDASGETQFCYDRFGNKTRKRQLVNGLSFTVRYAYSLAGKLASVTYPDGAVADYVRDAQGRVSEVGITPLAGTRTVVVGQVGYYPFGPVSSWVYGNGRAMTRVFDQNYRPYTVAVTGGSGLSLGYEFDAAGNLSKLYNSDRSAVRAQYGYDALNRLSQVKDGPTGTVIEQYAYDATGNRLSMTTAGGTVNYTYPALSHRLSKVGSITRTYDLAGNTKTIGVSAKAFNYDDTGRMSQARDSGVVKMNYAYNARGEQVRRYLGTANTYRTYDEAGHWLGEYDNLGDAAAQIIWMDDLPIAVLNRTNLRYLEPDHLGTPRVVIEPNNNLLWTWDLKGEAFGATQPKQDPQNIGAVYVFDMRFPGQVYDAASALNQNYLRDYEPGVGRYVESDPVGLVGGISTYGYAAGRPLDLIDPSGLCYQMGYLFVPNCRPAIPPPVMAAQPNGNTRPGFNGQDEKCSVEYASLGQYMDKSPCILQCCQQHDACYARNRCNESSWAGNMMMALYSKFVSAECQTCNSTVVRCISSALGKSGCCQPKP